jgi:hypothetical protein
MELREAISVIDVMVEYGDDLEKAAWQRLRRELESHEPAREWLSRFLRGRHE